MYWENKHMQCIKIPARGKNKIKPKYILFILLSQLFFVSKKKINQISHTKHQSERIQNEKK